MLILLFKIGAQEFWEHHNSNFNNNYDSDGESNDFVAQGKKDQLINVKKTNY